MKTLQKEIQITSSDSEVLGKGPKELVNSAFLPANFKEMEIWKKRNNQLDKQKQSGLEEPKFRVQNNEPLATDGEHYMINVKNI